MRTALVLVALSLAIAASDERPSRSFTMVYQATVRDVPANAKVVRMWIPIPLSNPDQEITNVSIALTSGGATVTKSLDAIGGVTSVGGKPVQCTVAAIQHGHGKSLCVETRGSAFSLRMTFDCKRYATRGGAKATREELEGLLKADHMVRLGGKVSKIADGIESDDDTMGTARRLYDFTLEQMRYDKPAGGEWGRGDSEWACDSHYGNCTDFHSYFMALARTKGIPARFEIGFPIPDGAEKVAKVGGYHCWAFFYADGKGWVPVDISEADKHSEKVEYFFGNLDANRVTMTGGRDLMLTPRPATGALNFFVYPHVEIDGKNASKTNLDKAFQRVNK